MDYFKNRYYVLKEALGVRWFVLGTLVTGLASYYPNSATKIAAWFGVTLPTLPSWLVFTFVLAVYVLYFVLAHAVELTDKLRPRLAFASSRQGMSQSETRRFCQIAVKNVSGTTAISNTQVILVRCETATSVVDGINRPLERFKGDVSAITMNSGMEEFYEAWMIQPIDVIGFDRLPLKGFYLAPYQADGDPDFQLSPGKAKITIRVSGDQTSHTDQDYFVNVIVDPKVEVEFRPWRKTDRLVDEKPKSIFSWLFPSETPRPA